MFCSSAEAGTYGASSNATLVYTATTLEGTSPADSTSSTDTGSIFA